LHLAAEYGHDKVVALLLSHSPKSIEAKDKFCRTALHYAALRGHDKVVVHLLSLVDETDHDSRTALHYAAEHGKENVIALLLAHRPQLIACLDSHRRTALHEAVIGGHDKAVEQLLQGRPTLIDKWTSNLTASILWSSSREAEEPVLLVDVQDYTRKTAFHYAALQNNEMVMSHLLAQQPSNLHRGDLVGRTAFALCCSTGTGEHGDAAAHARPPIAAERAWSRKYGGRTRLQSSYATLTERLLCTLHAPPTIGRSNFCSSRCPLAR